MTKNDTRLRCPDMGVCHHECRWSCFRVRCCGPLSGVFLNDRWPQTMIDAAMSRQIAGELEDSER